MESLFPFVVVAVFAVVAVFLLVRMFRHGGLRGMLFGAGVRRTVGEVEGASSGLVRTRVKVHVLDGAPERAVGVELVVKTFASYQMMPVALSASEARRLSAHLDAAARGQERA